MGLRGRQARPFLPGQGAPGQDPLDRPGWQGISGLVAEYIVAIDVARARFPADALLPVLICVYSHLNILVFTLAKSKFCW